MALKLLSRTQVSSLYPLAEAGFTKTNYDGVNTTIAAGAPLGVLGGSVAALDTDGKATAASQTTQPIGLFISNAAGAAWESSPAVASGVVGIVKGINSVLVDVYETRNAAGNANLTYAVGDKLYSSANGLLTKEASTSAVVVGIVTKVPTTASPFLGLETRI